MMHFGFYRLRRLAASGGAGWRGIMIDAAANY